MCSSECILGNVAARADIRSSSTCSGVLPRSRASCVSVAIFVGIRFKSAIFSGTDVLRQRPGFRNDENIFRKQRLRGRQTVGNFNGHGFLLPRTSAPGPDQPECPRCSQCRRTCAPCRAFTPQASSCAVGKLAVSGAGRVQDALVRASATCTTMAASFKAVHKLHGRVAAALDAEGHDAARSP